MISKLRFLLLILSLGVMAWSTYEFKFKDASEPWKNYTKPQLAAHSSLEKEGLILQELERQQRFQGYKINDPSLLDKPNIFNPLQP